MTTKYKIILGFLVMVLLLSTIAILGYTDIQKASDGFTEYRRLARLNVATSDLEAYMNRATAELNSFISNRDTRHMDNARKAIEESEVQIKGAQEFVLKPDRVTALAEMAKATQAFRRQIDAIQKDLLDGYKLYTEVVLPNARDGIPKAFAEMARQAKSVNNADSLYALNESWAEISAARSSVSRFSESRSSADAERGRTTLASTEASLKKLSATLHTEEGAKTHAALMQSFKALADAFSTMATQYKQVAKNLTDADKAAQQLVSSVHALSADINNEMLEFGRRTLQDNANAQKQMLFVSIAGIILGVVFAAFIVLGIVRVLSQLAGFAGAVSKGNFTTKLNIHEKGEIGSMIEAMRQIPTVLERVMHQADALADGIMSGRFRDRLDSGAFDGSFADLTKSVNTVSDAYTGVMDSLPIPIMSCDKNNAILFLNKIAQSAIGGNYTNTKCSGHLNAAECNKSGCFGNCAMANNALYAGETTIHPQGKRMDIAVTAMPMHNLQNSVVGYMEIITDLTEIKAKQATMLHVAKEASDISNRVAAASEQLAAQVEQISRGAEMQRSRVESTASAMTEMNATVLEVARSAGQASEQSEGTRQKAEDGAGLVNKVVSSINTVNSVAVTLQGNMQELGKQAESIGGVMNVISDIADQTNLLALNAAIEAARAGEAGRGFAVVADEVRKLAEKTMSATQEVGTSIKAIQNSARTNIQEVGNAVKSINDATSLANSSGAALKEIVDLAASNSAVVASIATAAEEQSATSEEINRSIEEINHVVGETTDGMVQSSAAVQDLSHMAQELRKVMEHLK